MPVSEHDFPLSGCLCYPVAKATRASADLILWQKKRSWWECMVCGSQDGCQEDACWSKGQGERLFHHRSEPCRLGSPLVCPMPVAAKDQLAEFPRGPRVKIVGQEERTGSCDLNVGRYKVSGKASGIYSVRSMVSLQFNVVVPAGEFSGLFGVHCAEHGVHSHTHGRF